MFETILGWIANALAVALDIVSWLPRALNLDQSMDSSDIISRVIATFIGISVSWLTVALICFLVLDWAAFKVMFGVRMITRPLDLPRAETAIRSAFRLHRSLLTAASFFGSSGYRPSRSPGSRPKVHSRQQRAAATALSLIVQLPFFIGQAFRILWALLTDRYVIIFAVGTWWYLFQPPAAYWSELPATIRVAITTFSPSAASTWIALFTAAATVVFASVRWRGRIAWRVSRYEQAYAQLAQLSRLAGNAISPIRARIEDASAQVRLTIHDTIEDLTDGRYHWDEESRTLESWSDSFSPTLWRPHRLRRELEGSRPSAPEDNPARQALKNLAAVAHDSSRPDVSRELWKISPAISRRALAELRFLRGRLPWEYDLPILAPDWADGHRTAFLDDHRFLVDEFAAAESDEDIDEYTLARANKAILALAETMSDDIAGSLWACEELDALATASARYIAPTLWDQVRAVISRG